MGTKEALWEGIAYSNFPGFLANHLRLKANDKVTNIRAVEADWLEGEARGLRGTFPRHRILPYEEVLHDAQLGNAAALFELGRRFDLGATDVKQDVNEGVKYYSMAVALGHVWAQYNLAQCYMDGTGVYRDLAKSLELLHLAAASHLPAIDSEHYQRSAEAGNSTGMWNLSRCYHFGVGVKKDPEQVLAWVTKAAECGDDVAQTVLADDYSKQGVYDSAFHWYLKAALQDNPVAQNSLGCAYSSGEGVEHDPALAYHWYQLAANQQNMHGLHNVGQCYFHGGEGVAQDKGKAVGYFLAAAELGHSLSMRALGEYFGAENKNLALAMKWFEMAALRGDLTSQCTLGRLCSAAEHNQHLAYMMLRMAVEQGDFNAKRSLKESWVPKIEKLR